MKAQIQLKYNFQLNLSPNLKPNLNCFSIKMSITRVELKLIGSIKRKKPEKLYSIITAINHLRSRQFFRLHLFHWRRTSLFIHGFFGDADLGFDELSEDAHLDQGLDRHVDVLEKLDEKFGLRADKLEGGRIDNGLDLRFSNVFVNENLNLFGVGLVLLVLCTMTKQILTLCSVIFVRKTPFNAVFKKYMIRITM